MQRTILAPLAEGEAIVAELVDPIDLSQHALFKHIKARVHFRRFLKTRRAEGDALVETLRTENDPPDGTS